jgi:hypothetical protein
MWWHWGGGIILLYIPLIYSFQNFTKPTDYLYNHKVPFSIRFIVEPEDYLIEAGTCSSIEE